MSDIITTLHPENDSAVNLYPNVLRDNIPSSVLNEIRKNSATRNAVAKNFTFNTGYYYNNNGVQVTYSNARCTDLISLQNTTYTVRGTSWASVPLVVAYDISGNFLRSYGSTSSQTTTTFSYVPAEDEYYARFQSYTSTASGYYLYLLSGYSTDETIIPLIKNYYVGTGGAVSSSAGSYCTDYIHIEDGDTFVYSGVYWARTVGYATYDENGTFLRYYYSNNDSGTLPAVTLTGINVTPASDEKYIRFSSLNDYIIVIKKNANLYKPDLANFIDSTFKGKTYITFGDSITAGYQLNGYSESGQLTDANNTVETYGKITADILNMTYHNFGASATGYSCNGSGTRVNTLPYIMDNNTYLPDSADIITIAHGTNDYALAELNQMPFGTLTDSDNTTFCGNVRLSFTKIMNKYPNAMVIVILPTPRTDVTGENAYGKTLSDYADAIKSIAYDFCFPVLDMLHEGRVNYKSSAFMSSYALDGLHFKSKFHVQYYMPKVLEIIRNNFINKFN